MTMEKLEDIVKALEGTWTRTSHHGLTIVITGASSGIGLVAAKTLAMMNPLHRLVLVARTLDKALYAKEQVASVLAATHPVVDDGEGGRAVPVAENSIINISSSSSSHLDHIIPLECDHCSLDSIHSFAKELERKLDETYTEHKWVYNGIDALCLNAAVLVAEGSMPRYTKDGLETTFQTNHLAPFLMANLLCKFINPGGRVVFTTSGLHLGIPSLDFSGMFADSVVTPGDEEEEEVVAFSRTFDMMDGTDFHFKRSYSLSKLCSVAVCVELNNRLRTNHKNVIATCFSPGLMYKSGLFRNQKDPSKDCSKNSNLSETVLRKAKSVEWGAGALVFMAIADEPGKQGGVYWSDDSLLGCTASYGEQFCASPVTEAVADDDKRRQLWNLSCELAGISCDLIHN